MENTWQGILVLTFYTVLDAMLRVYFVRKLHFVFCLLVHKEELFYSYHKGSESSFSWSSCLYLIHCQSIRSSSKQKFHSTL